MSREPVQLSQAELDELSQVEIVAAHKAGKLDALARGENPQHSSIAESEREQEQAAAGDDDGTAQIVDIEKLRRMSATEVVEAHRAGRLDAMIAGDA